MEPDDLITACGLYCGHCARWKDFTTFRAAARLLLEVADGHGFHHWMPAGMQEFDYCELQRGLQFLAAEDSWLVCRQPCTRHEGMACCRFRRCCEEHGVRTCCECASFPCETLQQAPPHVHRYHQEYRELGREAWLALCARRAEQGFELHTGCCYAVDARREAEATPAQEAHCVAQRTGAGARRPP